MIHGIRQTQKIHAKFVFIVSSISNVNLMKADTVFLHMEPIQGVMV